MCYLVGENEDYRIFLLKKSLTFFFNPKKAVPSQRFSINNFLKQQIKSTKRQ